METYMYSILANVGVLPKGESEGYFRVPKHITAKAMGSIYPSLPISNLGQRAALQVQEMEDTTV